MSVYNSVFLLLLLYWSFGGLMGSGLLGFAVRSPQFTLKSFIACSVSLHLSSFCVQNTVNFDPLFYIEPKLVCNLPVSCGWSPPRQACTEPETPFVGLVLKLIILCRIQIATLAGFYKKWDADSNEILFFTKAYLLFISIVFISVHIALVQVNEAIDQQDEVALMAGLNRPALSLLEVLPQNSSWYLMQLCNSKEQKMQVMEWNGTTHQLAFFFS